MDELLQWLIKIGVFTLMLVVGTDCTRAGLRDSFRRPALMAFVVLGQFVLVPLVVYGCCRMMALETMVTGSLMLAACCPTGSISNTHCYLARGNSSLSVALTALSCLVAVVTTPLALTGFRALTGEDSGMLPPIPVDSLVRELLYMMVVPLLIGGAIRELRPAWVAAHGKGLRLLSIGVVMLLVFLIIASDPAEVVRHLRGLVLVTALFTAALLVAGELMSRAFHLDRADRWAVLFEFPCRNLAIAAVVAFNVLDRPEYVRFAAAVFVIQAVMLLALTALVGRGARRSSTASS